MSSTEQTVAAPQVGRASLPRGRATFRQTVDGAEYDVTVTVAATDQGIRPVEVTVASTPGGPPVTGVVLRTVRVAELAREVVARFDENAAPDEGALRYVVGGQAVRPDLADLSDEAKARLRATGPTDENLQLVAAIYNEAALLGRHPAREVELKLGMPRTTASKWVRRARERGLILPPGQVAQIMRALEGVFDA